MKILVTGPSGLFGPILVKKLLGEGHDVTALVHSRSLDISGCRTVYGDITDINTLKHHFNEADAVCHLATAKGKSDSFINVNIGGLFNVLELVRTSEKPLPLVLLSGDNVLPIWDYPTTKPLDENHPYLHVDDAYGLSKVIEEVMALQYIKKYLLPITILRSSWIMEGTRVVSLCNPAKFGFKRYLNQEQFAEVASGVELRAVYYDCEVKPIRRSVTDPRDLADAFVWALTTPDIHGEIYNIASPAFNFLELANYLNRKSPIKTIDVILHDAFSFEMSTIKAENSGFKTTRTIFDTVDWALVRT